MKQAPALLERKPGKLRMWIKIEARPAPSNRMRYLSPLIAVALTLVTGVVFSAVMSLNPLSTFHAFFISPIDDWYGVGELGVKATPLILIGTGLAIEIGRAHV